MGRAVRHPSSTTTGSRGLGRLSEGPVSVGDVDRFVVWDTSVQAVPEDLEPAIPERPERRVVPFAPCALRVVELPSPPRAPERAERPLLDGTAEIAVVREPARHDELGLSRAARDRGLARVALQRVRRVELFGMIADLTGDPGGEAIAQARKAQVDLAARKALPQPVSSRLFVSSFPPPPPPP